MNKRQKKKLASKQSEVTFQEAWDIIAFYLGKTPNSHCFFVNQTGNDEFDKYDGVNFYIYNLDGFKVKSNLKDGSNGN